MDIKQAQELTQKYLDGQCSPEEKAVFESWYNETVKNQPDPIGEPDYKALHQHLASVLPAGGRRKQTLWPRIAVAAAAVAAITIGIWFYTSRPIVNRNPQIVNQNDIAPGKNKATIILGSGKVYQLSDAKSGVIVGAKELTYNDGSAVGHAGPELVSGSLPQQLTVTTPRGGTYQITLPDGTRVWLNAASSLTYSGPLKERGGLRKVDLIGEAYFEVFRNKNQPFVVNSRKMEITVLGTHFNVDAYPDESSTKTTLLEGSVKVSALQDVDRKSNIVNLVPNEQAVLTRTNEITVQTVDVNEAIAWKNGEFVFNDEPLENIMRKISRWYDVEIVYDGVDPKKPFWGSISRFENVSKVLQKLELTGSLHFQIEGRKIIVKK